MAASVSTAHERLTTLDGRIARALVLLREARIVAVRSPTQDALRRETRAEENLNVLLDYRNSVRQRSGGSGPW